MKKIVAILGTYRKGGMTDQVVDAVLEAAAGRGAQVEKIYLIDQTIAYCDNCRACTQTAGETRGICPIEDDMAGILDRIEAADGIVLASPTNFFNATACFRAFMERSVCYTYWPWEKMAPKFRVKRPTKKAVLITGSAAPALLGRMMYGTVRALKISAKTLGAKPIGTICTSFAAKEPGNSPSPKVLAKARKLGERLVK